MRKVVLTVDGAKLAEILHLPLDQVLSVFSDGRVASFLIERWAKIHLGTAELEVVRTMTQGGLGLMQSKNAGVGRAPETRAGMEARYRAMPFVTLGDASHFPAIYLWRPSGAAVARLIHSAESYKKIPCSTVREWLREEERPGREEERNP